MDEQSTWAEIMRRIVESGTWAAVCLGGIGGVVNVLIDDKATRRDVLRYFLLGSVIAAACGSVVIAVVVKFTNLPPEVIPAGIAAGPASFLAGFFGPRILAKIGGKI